MKSRWLCVLGLFLALGAGPGRASDQPYEIQLQEGKYTPEVGVSAAVEKALADRATDLKAQGRSKVHVLVQLFDIPDEGEKSTLGREGLELGIYVPRNAWIAAVPVDKLAQVTKRSDVRYLTLWDETRKVHPRLRIGEVSAWARDTADPSLIKVHVELHADVDMAVGQRLAAEVGAAEVVVIEGVRGFEFWMPEKALGLLAKNEDVLWIEEVSSDFVGQNDGARSNLRSETFHNNPYSLNGTGVRLFVLDTQAVRSTHETFNPGSGTRVTIIDTSTPGDHATHVAGTAAGDGSGSTLVRGRGVTNEPTILSGGASNSGVIENRYTTARNTHNADLSNNSIGFIVADDPSVNCNGEGDYTATGNLLDGIVRGNNPNVSGSVIMTWSNGNERGAGPTNPPFSQTGPFGRCGAGYRTTPPPSCAKNPIHVGAVNSDGDSMTSFSSWGPCDDGRMKPVISGPGCETGLINTEGGIFSSVCVTTPGGACNSNNAYGVKCGTSMAAPAVAGVIAQYIEDWRARGFGTSTQRPLPALVKAMLIHTARDRGQNGPDYIFGYGAVDGRSLLELSRLGGTLASTQRERWGTGSISSGNQTFTIAVPAGAGDLKATLAWDDFPAASLSNGALVNNLNLELVAPNGITVHQAWVLNSTNPYLAATTGTNTIDNQEQVLVTNPTAGTWTVRVVAASVPQGPQTYGLVITSDRLTHSPATCTTASSTFESGNDGWTLSGASRLASPAAGHGSWSLRLGGATGGPPNVQTSAVKSFTIPTWAGKAELSFFWYMTTSEPQSSTTNPTRPGWNHDFLLVEVLPATGTTTLAVPDLRFDGWQAGQWLHQAHIDLTPWRGQTIRVRFRSGNDPNNATTFWVDDIALNTCEHADLWARDLPADTGAEPGAPGDMWTSPDVWVTRTSTDMTSRNPLINSWNYIRVNVRNRSTVTASSVTVEAYVANAGVSLAWPNSWTFINSVTLTNVGPGGPVLATIPWWPSALGHYCILIRILGDGDPMTVPESNDVGYNTFQNNNIVWRNVNVVQFSWQRSQRGETEPGHPLGPVTPIDPDFPPVQGPWIDAGENYNPENGHVQFLFGNIEGVDALLYLQFVDRTEKEIGHPFIKRGQITVSLPKELAERWAETGGEGKGIEKIDDLTFRLAEPDAYMAVKMPAGVEYPVTMDIEDMGSEQLATPYLFSVVEHRTPESLTNREIPAVGGVTYEIHTTPITPVQTGVIGGKVTANGEALPGILVSVTDVNGATVATVTNADGVYQVSVPEGLYVVSFELAGCEQVRNEVRVTPGEVTTLDAELRCKAAKAPR